MILKKISFAFVLVLASLFVEAQNSQFQALAWNVSGDTIFKRISNLSEMERYTYGNDPTVVEYLMTRFESLGYDTIYTQEWDVNGNPNIVIERWGSVYPDSIIVLGAHYDSYSIGAPGADDNASGTSGVMETARVLKNAEFEKTIRFVLFSGEELGLLGSYYNAQQSFQNGEMIKLMINLDMISYVHDGNDPVVHVIYDTLSLYNNYKDVISNYFPGFNYNDAYNSGVSGASDHKSFWDFGYSALFLIDSHDFGAPDFNNYIHTDQDLIDISANSQYLAEGIVKSVVISLCEYAGYLGGSQNIISEDSESDFRIFPNPADDIIYLQLNEATQKVVEVQIISGTGVLMEEKEIVSSGFNSACMIDIGNYFPGLYVIKVVTNSGNYTRKVIVY